MAGFLPWLNANWFSVFQTVGLLGTLWYTAVTFRRDTKVREDDTKARRVSNILAFSKRHREIWGDVYQPDDLKRIFLKQVDLNAIPPTLAEIEYLRGRAADFEDGWEIANLTDKSKLEPLALDAAEFFSLPLPAFVWRQTKKFRTPKFVEFVERAIRNTSNSSISEEGEA